MISKELLSEVLEVEVFDIVNDKNTPINMFQYEIKKRMLDGSLVAYREINIHELAHKCKEWAYEEGLILYSSFGGYECYIDGRRFSDHKDVRFLSVSEPEVIFQACQWILDSKEEKWKS